MKILMLAPQPFFEPRGTPISVLQRLIALSKLGYEIDLVTYHLGSEVQLDNVTIHRTPPIPFVKKIKIGPSWIKPLLDLLLFLRAIPLLLTNRYDVIHSHEEAAFIAIIFSALFRTYHIYDMHSSLPKQLENFNFGNVSFIVSVFAALERLTLNTCHAVITVGDDLEAHVMKINNRVMHHKIENISLRSVFLPSTEDKNKLRESLDLGNRPLVVYTGTFESYQGLPLLIKSVEIVRRKVPDVAFVLVGGKPEQVHDLQQSVDAACLEDNVIMVGTVPPIEALGYAELADILVSPRTLDTSVPLKIYSYLATGKPIVATRIKAHTQVIKDNHAMLVDVDPDAFAAGILCLIEDKELGKRLAKSGKQLAEEHHNIDSLVAKWRKAYLPFYTNHSLAVEPKRPKTVFPES